MLMLPDDFVFASTLPVQSAEAGWWFVVAGDRLLVQSTQVGTELPIAREWPFADWPIVRRLDLGTLQGRPCYAVEAANQEPPPGQGLGCGAFLVFVGLLGAALFFGAMLG